MNDFEKIEQKYDLVLPEAYRSMQARGWLDVKSDDYFWLLEAEWMPLRDILEHEPEEYQKPGFVPFAFEADGSHWSWWPAAHPETVVLCPRDYYDGEFYAPSFVGFVYRRLLDYAGSVRLEEEQEVRQYLRDWSLRLSEYLPASWINTLKTLASAELIRWSYKGKASGWGLMTYEQKRAITQRDLAFPLLDEEFQWMYP